MKHQYQFSFVIIIQIVTCVHLMDNSVTALKKVQKQVTEKPFTSKWKNEM